MAYNTTKVLGYYLSTDVVYTGVLAPFTGDYELEVVINGKTTVSTVSLVAGAKVSIPNGYLDNVTISFRLKYPVANQSNGSYWVNSEIGEIWFEFINRP